MAESFPNMDREIIEKVQATSNRINTKVFISKSILPTKVKLVNIKTKRKSWNQHKNEKLHKGMNQIQLLFH